MYDRVHKEVFEWGLEKKYVITRYVDLINDMYDISVTNIRMVRGDARVSNYDRFTLRFNIQPLFVRFSYGWTN